MSRVLSPYEKTHLKRFGQTPTQKHLKISQYGQMPVEYITGRVEFLERIFHVDQRVMIPRLESEKLIELALKKIRQFAHKNLKIADVGCGCGALGISLYLELRKRGYQPQLYLSDVSAEAMQVAKKNVARLLGSSDEISFIVSDLLQTYPRHQKFDLLLANLPYIPHSRLKTLDASVQNFEPHLALAGGKLGLKYIQPFLKQAQPHLTDHSLVLLEVDHTHSKQILERHLDLTHYQLTVQADQFGRNRFAICTYRE